MKHSILFNAFRLPMVLALVTAAGCVRKDSSSSTNLIPTAVTSSPAESPKRAATPAPAPTPNLPTNLPSRTAAIDPALPTIFIAGDSTAARGTGEAQQGWGVPFGDYFDRSKVNVLNRARGGRSSRTYVSEGLWDQLLADVKQGDIVLIQFGRNDGGAINAASRARGSLRGLGEETQGIDNQVTKKHEIVHTYGWYLRKMISDTKAKGATPIVLSLTVRNVWKDGKVEREANYGQWAYETARATHVLFLNVSDKVADELQAMGEEKVAALYPRDHTHFNVAGADIHAAAVVSLLRGLRPSPIQRFLSPKGQSVAVDRFGWLQVPRGRIPRSAFFSSAIPRNATAATMVLAGNGVG
jgi:lysophospholipase L1-like esterase